jgi:hypothetical protein
MKTTTRTQPRTIRRIGTFPGDPFLTYQLCDDGNVYYCGARILSNCGPLSEFLEKAEAGAIRCKLDADK